MNGQQFVAPFPMMAIQQVSPPDHNEPPARIRVAMELLAMFTVKTTDKVIPSGEFNCHTLDGQKLTEQEEIARSRACIMLQDYFLGRMEPNTWEQKLLDPPKGLTPVGNQPGRVIVCFHCASSSGTPKRSCVFCKGTGMLLIYPTEGEKAEET